MSAPHLTGGCACGRVRYVCDAPPLVQMICHCRDCQRASGSAFASVMVVPTDRLDLTGGPLGSHAVRTGTGRTLERRFCPGCGAPGAAFRPETPAITFLHVASLDDPSAFAPTLEVWMSRAAPWHPVHPGTVKFPEGPDAQLVLGPIAAYFAGRGA